MTDLNPIQAGTPEVPQPTVAQSFVDKVAIPALVELNSAYADAARRKEAADKARQAEQDAANAELSLMASGGELPADIKQQSVAWQMSAMFQKGRAIAIEETNKIEQEFNQSPEAFLQKHGSTTNAFQQMAERWKPQIEQDEYAQKGFTESLFQRQQALSQLESRFVMQKQQETAVNDIQTNLAAAFDTVLRQPIVAPSQQQPVTAPTNAPATSVAAKPSEAKPSAAPTPTGKGKRFSQDVESVIATVSQKNGIPLDYLRAVAEIESSGNPSASRGPKSAKGLFQFVPKTAKLYGIKGKELDLQANTEAAGRLTIDNMKALQGLRKDGIDVSDPKNHYLLYLAHQQGAGGAIEIIKAAKSGGKVSAEVRSNIDNNGGKGKSPQQFLDSWKAKYDKNLAIVGSSAGEQGSPVTTTPSAQTTPSATPAPAPAPAPTVTPTTITSAPISPDQIEALKKNIEAQGFVHPQGSNAAQEIAANALLQMAVQHNRPEVLTPEFFKQLGIENQYGGKLPQVLAAQGQINRNADIERNAQLRQEKEQREMRGTLFADAVNKVTADSFVNLTPELSAQLYDQARSKMETGEISKEKFLDISTALTNKMEAQKKAEIKTQVQQQKQAFVASKNAVRASLNGYIESIKQGKGGDKAGVVNNIDGLVKISEQSAEPIYQRDVDEITAMVVDAYQQKLITEPQAQSYIQKINRNVTKIESEADKELAKQEKEQRKASAQQSLRKSINDVLNKTTNSNDIFLAVSNAYNTSELSEKERKDIVEEIFNGMADFGIDANGQLTANTPAAMVPTGLTTELAGKSLQVFAATGVTPDKYKFFSGQLAALTGDLGNKKSVDVMPRLDAYTRLIADIESKNPVTFDNLLKGLDGKSSEAIYQLNKDLLQTGTPPETRFNLLLQLKQNQEIYDKSLSQMNATEQQKFMEFSRLASSELKDLEKAGFKQFIDAVIPAFASKESVKPSYLRWGVGFLTDSRVDFVDGLPDAAMSYAKRFSALKASGVRGAAELAAKAIATEYEAVLVPNISYSKGVTANNDALSLGMDIKPTTDSAESSGNLFAKAILIPKSALNRPVTVEFLGKKEMAPSITPNYLSQVIEAKKKEIVLSIAKRIKNGDTISPNEKSVFEDPNLIEVRYLKGTNTVIIKHPNAP